jgi:hypothetical protein
MNHPRDFNFAVTPVLRYSEEPGRRSKEPRSFEYLRDRRRRGGYVLLVTLGLLVLSTTLLVAVGRAAAHHALAARLEQSELQQRWGVISCRSAILGSAEQILVSQEQQQKRAVPQYRATLQLGGDQFTLIVSDEQAKANLNLMIDQFGAQGTEDRLAQSLTGTGLLNHLRLRPSVYADDPATTRPVAFPQLISGPGQVFDSVAPELLLSPLQNLTCWGSGALNVMRADQTSMRSVLAPALTRIEISSLIGARDKIMKLSVDLHLAASAAPAKNTDAISSLLAQAKIDNKVRNRLSLTTRSACHSLWIIVRDSRRAWHSLSVSDESDPNRPLIHSIVW